MARHGGWRWRLAACAVAAGLLAGPGCLCFVHPLPAPPPELAEPCQAVPKCARDHVYVFLVHGLDPLDFANLEGVRDYVQQLGFHQTYYGQLYHTGYFRRKIQQIHGDDPDAHFVLIGFSFGANMVRDLAQAMAAEGIPVDLLVYFGGNTLHNVPADRPANAVRIVNVLASDGWVWNGAALDGAENLEADGVWHFGSPTHPQSVAALARGLAEVAATVPVPAPPAPAAEPETAPMPRPVTEPPPAHGEEWDFLKPVARLGDHPPAQAEPAPAPDAPRTVPGRTVSREKP